MEKYAYIFCIVVYRDVAEIVDCIESIKEKVSDYKIILINSFYDDKSERELKSIAIEYNCDFISVENNGYGYGNNCGIEYAIKKYEFQFLVISNPDIVILEFNDSFIRKYDNCVIAPLIKTLREKNQNPYWMIKNSFSEWLIYMGHSKKNRLILYFGIGINKIIREVGLFFFNIGSKKEMKIYAAHGSFCMFSKKVLDKIGLPYDSNMFLFAEEAYLAHVLEENDIKTIITKNIQIKHKEDSAVKLSKINESDELRKSVIYYYKKF